MKMFMGYTELRYVGIMKTLCSFLDRLFIARGTNRGVSRDVVYGSGKYHYIERVGDIQTYEFADRSPLDVLKDIIERANTKLQ